MRWFGPLSVGVATLLLTSCGLLNGTATQQNPGADWVEQAAGGCGVERWSVKTGTDSQASSVNLTPQATTIGALGAIAPPNPIPPSSRVAPTELQAVQLTNITLTEFKLESDSDTHLVLTDGSNTMIGEIPSTTCVGSGSPFASGIAAAAATFATKFTPSPSFQPANVVVTIIGVPMFDFAHGQTGAAPNFIEIHPVLGMCFGTNCMGGTTNDFSISVTPPSATVAPGGVATYTVATQVASGSAESVNLSVSGLPSGLTGTLAQTSVQSGASTTLTVTAASTASAGTSSFSVTGSDGAHSHGASGQVTVSGSTGQNVVFNAGFELGTLQGWTPLGTSHLSRFAHTGTFAAQLGGNFPTGDSAITQQVTLPGGTVTLSVWAVITCPDVVTNDWTTVQILSPAGTVLATPLPKTCTNTHGWTNFTADLSSLAGQTVILSLQNHDDGRFGGNATNTEYDDISITGTTTLPTTSITSPANGATVSGNTPITAVAASPAGIAKVEFFVDGTLLSTATASPYSANWNTTAVANGSHTLTTQAFDPSNNVGTSTPVTLTVNNSVTLPTTTITAPANNATVSGTTPITATASSPAGIAKVEFFVDGTLLSTATASPYTASWNTTTAANGTHTLTTQAFDPSNNVGTSTPVTITVNNATGHVIKHVFIILMENHNWSSIKGSSSAPYINNTLLPMASHAEAYNNVPGIHPSLPNYLWLEAGTNFGILADGLPSQLHQSTSQHLVTLLQNAGLSWKSYQEDISGATCPLTTAGLYAPKHNAMVFFDDVTNTNSSTSQECIQHVRPFTELATDLAGGTVASYNFITPNLCDDMHNSSGCATSDSVANGDTWLSQNVPTILNSAAFKADGALFITWDESEGGDFPIGMIVVSPFAKGGGFSNNIPYNHGSTLRTFQEIFNVQPFLGDAANQTDLSALFTQFP
jgi:hypothetical protein